MKDEGGKLKEEGRRKKEEGVKGRRVARSGTPGRGVDEEERMKAEGGRMQGG